MSSASRSQSRLEHERPSEWLRSLEEEPNAYGALMDGSGGLARAAYRLARARCRVQLGAHDTPTLRELRAAALTIAERVGVTETLPITSLLASDCEEQGLPLIRPLPTPPTSRRSSIPLPRAANG